MVLFAGAALFLLLLIVDLWRRSAGKSLPWAGRALRKGSVRARKDKDGRPLGFELALPCARGLEFRIRYESGVDLLAKSAGVTREPQVGERQFDRDFYLETDDAGIARRIGEDEDLRRAVLALFERVRGNGFRVLALSCMQGRMAAEVHCESAAYAPRAQALVRQRMEPLASAFWGSGAERGGVRDPMPARARLLLAIPSALALVVLIAWLARPYLGYRMLDGFGLFLVSLPIGLAATALYGWIVVRVLRRGARTHLVLLEGGVLAMVGFVGAAWFAAYHANRIFDDAGARELVHPRGAYTSRWTFGDRGPIAWLQVPDWRPERRGKTVEIALDEAESRPFVIGSRIRNPTAVIEIRPGALGYPWIERVFGRAPEKGDGGN